MQHELRTTRRCFLQKGLTLVGAGATVPGFVDQTASALDQSTTSGSDERILVVVQLAGGNDGLNTVIPFGNDVFQNY